MKRKTVMGIMAITLAMSVTACASKTGDTAETKAAQSEAVAVADETAETEKSQSEETTAPEEAAETEAAASDERNEYGLTSEETDQLVSLVEQKVTDQYLNKYDIAPADFTFPEYQPVINDYDMTADNLWALVDGSMDENDSAYDLSTIVMIGEMAGYDKEKTIEDIKTAINEGAISFKDSWKEQRALEYQWFSENDPQNGDLIGAVYEGIVAFLNGLDVDERAEVLYDVYAKNVYEAGTDDDGKKLHTMFAQVIIQNATFE